MLVDESSALTSGHPKRAVAGGGARGTFLPSKLDDLDQRGFALKTFIWSEKIVLGEKKKIGTAQIFFFSRFWSPKMAKIDQNQAKSSKIMQNHAKSIKKPSKMVKNGSKMVKKKNICAVPIFFFWP